MSVEPLQSIESSATWLGISPWTVRKRVRQGQIRTVRIGRRVLIEPDEIRRIIEEGRGAGRVSHTDLPAHVNGGVR
jgi:excisionase family DNA binding protein